MNKRINKIQKAKKNNDAAEGEILRLQKPAARALQGGEKQWLRPVLLLAVVILILVLSRISGVGERLGQLLHWIGSLGAWGPAVYVDLYIIGVVAALPGSALTVAEGTLFGSLLGVLLVSFASTVGAGLSFLIARYFTRDSVARWLEHNEKFRRPDNLTEKHGAMIVALTRLVPIFPFNMLNYGFGLTRVPFWSYLFWSWLCRLPGMVVYVPGADAVFKAVSRARCPVLR